MSRLRPLLWSLLIVATAGVVLSSVEAPSAAPDESPRAVEGAPRPALPERFAPWPPFVISWEVSGPIRQAGSIFGAGLTWNPCGAVDTTPCHIRLAWEDYRNWSVTVSPDRRFEDRDVHRITIGPLHYGLAEGVVFGIRDSSFIPPLDACDEVLLTAQREGPRDVARSAADPPAPADWSVLTLVLGDGEHARCLGPSGIPLSFSRQGHAWEPTSVELRNPSPKEIGLPLVEAGAPRAVAVGCAGLYSSPAGRWLTGLAEAHGSYTVEDVGEGLALYNALLTGRRPALIWLTVSTPPPEGHRLREISPGVVAAEVLRPDPVLTVELGDLRLWATFLEEVESSPVLLEQAAYQLGTVARDLATQADRTPYRGSLPDC